MLQMEVQRNPRYVAGVPADPNARILDAALEQFEDLGIRRSTLEDIARRAGVDRVTVYRRLGSRDDVVQAVVIREAERTFSSVFALVEPTHTAEERVAVVFTAIVRRMWTHTLFNRLVKLEPEVALARMTTEAGGVVATAVAATVAMMNQAVVDGVLAPAQDFATRAEIIVRIAHSFIVTPRAHLGIESDDELMALARGYIAPIVTRA